MKKESTINYQQILLNDPLFSEYSLIDVDRMDLLNLLFYEENNSAYSKLKIIDSYCTICKKDTTFTSENLYNTERDDLTHLLFSAGMVSGFPGAKPKITLLEDLDKRCVFIRKFNCPRHPLDSTHSQIFIFRIKGTTLIKIGQHPTLAELTKENIKKYRNLSNEIYSELNRAIGLSSHGIGIGSFVYLRRIIEKHIVYPKIEELIKDGEIKREQIVQYDFKQKIKLAKSELPLFLVENVKIYSILSKGIHELEEEECKEYFPILRTAIEIILDEHIEKIERNKKNKIIANQINKIT